MLSDNEKYHAGCASEDEAFSIDEFKRLASNDPEKQYTLGLMYELGEGVEEDVCQAAFWFEKAADNNVKEAQHKMGVYYSKGIGVSKDLGKAIDLFSKASAKGHLESSFLLKICLQENKKIQSNYQEIVKLLREAKHVGNKTAEMILQKVLSANAEQYRIQSEEKIAENRRMLKQESESLRDNRRIDIIHKLDSFVCNINQDFTEIERKEFNQYLEKALTSSIIHISFLRDNDILTKAVLEEKETEIYTELFKIYKKCSENEYCKDDTLKTIFLLAKKLKINLKDLEAIKYYELILKNSKKELPAEFFFELGESHLNTGSYKESVQYFCYALELASNVDGIDSDQVNKISKYLDIVDCYFVIDSVYGYPDQGVLVKTYHTMFKAEDVRTREIEKILRGLTRLQEKVESFADQYGNYKIKKDKVSEVIHKIQDKDQFPEARNFMDHDKGKGIITVVGESREYEWQGNSKRLEEARQQENISQSLKSYTVDLLARIEKEYNWLFNLLPKHTFLSLGSMARNEMCAYSDLEFALLLDEEPKDENIKQHFKMLVGLIELRVLALGETEFELTSGAKVLRKGYRFDEGGNTPFGKEETFFGTKEHLLSSINDLKDHTGDLITANVLQDAGYLSGDEELFKDYKKDLCTVLQESDRQKIIAVRLLSDHLKDFEVFDSSSDILDVKKDLLRFPVFFVNCLSLYHGIKYPDIRDNNTAMKINGLVNKGEMDKTTGDIIKTTISYTLSLRNAIHLAHGKEKESLQMQDALAKGYQFNNGFKKLVKSLEEIYRTLYQLAKDFIGYYNNIVTDNPCLESIFTEESLSNLKGEDNRKGFMLGVISKNGCRRECTPLSEYNTTNGRST